MVPPVPDQLTPWCAVIGPSRLGVVGQQLSTMRRQSERRANGRIWTGGFWTAALVQTEEHLLVPGVMSPLFLFCFFYQRQGDKESIAD